MPDLRQLHDLTEQVRTPALTELAGLAARRRRRAAAGLAGAVAASLVLAAVLAAGVTGQRGATPDPVGPAPEPSPRVSRPPSQLVRTFPTLTAEQIRQHPDARTSDEVDYPATGAPGVGARTWSVCLYECTRATEHVPGELQQALEVSHDGFKTGALYALDGSDSISHAVDGWYLIDGGPTLVDSRGRSRALTRGSAVPITDVAGPPVHSAQGLAYLDLGARTLHAIEREGEGYWDWQRAEDTWFWGTATQDDGDVAFVRHAAVWRKPDGSFGVEVLPIGESRISTGMLTAGRPGTLAVVEHDAEPRLAHISADFGVTWQIRQVPDGVPSGGSLPADWTSWPRG